MSYFVMQVNGKIRQDLVSNLIIYIMYSPFFFSNNIFLSFTQIKNPFKFIQQIYRGKILAK